ncbi:hypothetical protein J4Q44_G00376870 [Coregonus suidteri]|uniref:Uncharacterized protein n=1 Tax=Coregonus suidteri TaxID=861788 RepID=A0AAN8KGB9_9TELE
MSHTLRSEDQEVELVSRRILGKEVNLTLVTPLPQWGQRLHSLREGLGSIPVVTLVCLCVLLLGLAITQGVLYASNMTRLQAEEAHFAQMKENLTVQRELLSSGLRDCEANLTKVKDLLATIQVVAPGSSTSVLVGVVVGLVVAGVLLVILLVLLWRYQKQHRPTQPQSTSQDPNRTKDLPRARLLILGIHISSMVSLSAQTSTTLLSL